jgi:hypothetical protein
VTREGPRSTRPRRNAIEASDAAFPTPGTCYREDTIPRPFVTGRLRQGREHDGALLVSLQEIAALMRRHLAAVLVVIICAAAVAVVFKRTPVTYQESVTVVFNDPVSAGFPNPYTSFSGSLVKAAGLMAASVMSPQDGQKIRAAGGTASYDVALYNGYNLEYPDYSDPYVIVTAAATNPAQVQHTFTAVTQQLYSDLVSRQVQAGVSTVDRITADLVGDSGPLPQPGSSKRVDVGLLVLAIIATFAVAIFLDRRPMRLSRLLRRSGFPGTRTGDGGSARLREQPVP